ncbi:MAG: non-homologous end-joining DNA ligase [Desulfobacterales bacterium]
MIENLSMKVDSRTIELSNADKVLFPEDGITKSDLIDYYHRMADRILPYLEDRPIMLQRFPDGIAETGFYQKQASDYFPDWIPTATVELKDRDEVQSMVVCNDAATLVYLANQACITLHAWLSRRATSHRPDRMIFDLDPAGDDFEEVCEAARHLREVLEHVGLTPYVMTTGSKGLHVAVPLKPGASFDDVRDFARDLATYLVDRHADRYTIEPRKEKRERRLYLDYLRNGYGQTAVGPYAIRAKAGAPIATPLDWEELSDGRLRSNRYTLRNIFRRLGQKDDPWSDMDRHARPLTTPQKRLAEMIDSVD